MSRQREAGYDESGAALLMLLLVLMIFVGGLVVYTSHDAEEIRISERDQTARALARAKEALLVYAATQWVGQATLRPGELPCADTNNNGDLSGESGNACQNMGWLPWKTLELEDLRDVSGHRLWYAVSEDFEDDGNAEPVISPASIAQFSIRDDLGIETGRAAAVIIAPGPALAWQVRSAADNNVAVIDQYLEGDNLGFDTTFTDVATATLNDQVMTITVDEIMARVAPLAMGEIASALRQFYAAESFYPYSELDTTATCDNGTSASMRNIGFPVINVVTGTGECPYDKSLRDYGLPSWVADLNWHKHVFSIVAGACVSGTVNCNGAGFLSLDGTGGIEAMTVYVGRELQDIDCATQTDYDQDRVDMPAAGWDDPCNFLETVENTNGDDDLVYVRPALSENSNDKFMIVAP